MARVRIYIKPFNPDGTYATDFIEVTKDVLDSSVGRVQRKLDISEYDIGVFTNSATSFSLRNDHGRYSDVGNINSIFSLKRSDSIVKITWDIANWDFFAGLSEAGEVQGLETTLFQGLLSDESTQMDANDQKVSFDILGHETIFSRVLAPDWVGTPPADNKCSTLLKAAIAAANTGISQPVLTIDNTQIVPSNDIVFDDLTIFANKTCSEAINKILQVSNSVLYIPTVTPIVSGRAESGSISWHFFGPGSSRGAENIIELKNIRPGINRTFNYLSWKDAGLTASNASSQSSYGIRKKEISFDGVTNSAKRQSILDALASEFGNPRQEFNLSTPLTYDALAIGLLSQGDIDFPLIPVDDETLPLYGTAQYGVSIYPKTLSSLQILTSEPYKVLGIDIDAMKNRIDFKMRRTG